MSRSGGYEKDSQIYVSSDGVYDKAATINGLKGFEPTEVMFSDWKSIPVDKDIVVVTYTVNVKGNQNGKPLPPESVRATSAWVNRDGKWLSIYHQDTAVKTAPTPTPTPTPSKVVQPTRKGTPAPPAPAATLASSGADPIVNEKMVWDALKRKDYDAFAAFLASDAIEVEQEAVYDKAGSVKAVSSIDLSKALLSEWKTVKLNDNAMLVTYMVRLPGATPDQERHTTIWVNRGGKWLALFHQGTPAKLPEVRVIPGVVATPTPRKMKTKM